MSPLSEPVFPPEYYAWQKSCEKQSAALNAYMNSLVLWRLVFCPWTICSRAAEYLAAARAEADAFVAARRAFRDADPMPEQYSAPTPTGPQCGAV